MANTKISADQVEELLLKANLTAVFSLIVKLWILCKT